LKPTPRQILLVIAAILSIGSLYFYRTTELGRGDARPAALEILNPSGELAGPEGIQFDAQGGLYAGTSQGLVWTLEPGGTPHIYAQLDQVQPIPGVSASSGSILAGGMAFDPAGNLYVAAFDFAGGSILRVDAGTRQVHFFAHGTGVANSLVLSRDSRHLWVSDYRRQGRLLRYTIGGAIPAQPDLVVSGLSYPNGLALGKDDKWLYIAETYSGNIARIDLSAEKPGIERVANLKGRLAIGSLDGLTFDPRDPNRRFLYVAENLRGLFTVLDLQAQPVRVLKQIGVAQMSGRPCPASLVIRDGYLYFTDIWSCNPLRIALGFPKYHQFVFRFKITDLAMVY
jgi:sugar lactone lactonase YvrE